MLHIHDSSPTPWSTARTLTLNDDINGVLWRDSDSTEPRPLVLIAHGGGQNSQAPNVHARAELLAARGYDSVARDAPGHGSRPKSPAEETLIAQMRSAYEQGPEAVAEAVGALNRELVRRAVPEWMLLLDDLEQQGLRDTDAGIGYWGLSLGAAIGFALLETESRISAAVLGLAGDNLIEFAPAVTAPVQFVMQWDDELVDRDSALRLYSTIGSPNKSLHANPGKHADVPRHEHANALTFFDRQLKATA